MQTRRQSAEPDVVAPDGSAIRLLVSGGRASTVHCSLQAGETTAAVRHRTVEEIWYCLSGRGELWRKLEGQEQITPLEPGVSVDIPLGVEFQFRAADDQPLEILIATMPPWPGEDEAVAVKGPWAASA